MSTPIDGSSSLYRSFHQTQRTESSSPSDANAQQIDSSPDSPANGQAEDVQSLSAAEREMIEREFPDNPDLSMELYGRNRGSETVNPEALGNQIDVRG